MTETELIASLDGETCMCGYLDTYRPRPIAFDVETFSAHVFHLRFPSWTISETPTQIILSGCSDETRASIEIYIFTRG